MRAQNAAPSVRHFLEGECKTVIDKFKTLPFGELPNRGKSFNTVAVYPDGRTATISVMVEEESRERFLVIVQCFMPMKGIMGWLRVKHVEVDGFRRYADGRIEQLDNATLYQYD